MLLYQRYVCVQIGDEDGNAISIDGLYIQFEIKKTLSSTPNEGMIKIYNLSDLTVAFIKEKGVRARLLAGYGGEAYLLFDGDIKRVFADKNGVDKICSIAVGGNVHKISNAIANVSYSGPVSIRQIIYDTIGGFFLSYSRLDIVPTDPIDDFSFTGLTSDLYDKLLIPKGIGWYEDDGFIHFHYKGEAETESVAVLNATSGLIGSPTYSDISLGPVTGAQTTVASGSINPISSTVPGIKFVSLINGNIRLSSRVKIESSTINGVYKCTQVVYRGDNRDGDYFIEGLGIETK